jgi:hypothetical protein
LLGKLTSQEELYEQYRRCPEIALWLEVENAEEGQKVLDYFVQREHQEWTRSRQAIPFYLILFAIFVAANRSFVRSKR